MGEVHAATPELTEEETSLYDRQIRLWGLESQKRLRAVRVLLAGLNGLGAEVAKNLVLAGIKSITLLDHRTVTDADFSTQFMIPRSDVGQNRAHSSVLYLANLNPTVEVGAEDGRLEDKGEEYLGKFDVVCCCKGLTREKLVGVNALCRKRGVKFYCGRTWGFFGYFFSDLIKHAYTEEVPLLPGTPGLENNAKMEQVASTVVKKVMTCVPLSKALQVKAGKAGTGLDRKTSPYFFLLHVVLRFYDKHRAAPSDCNRAELISLWDEVAEELGVEKERLPDSLFDTIDQEMCATGAVVGGVLAQDIIKVASCKDQPLKNFFLFDGIECCGLEENIGR